MSDVSAANNVPEAPAAHAAAPMTHAAVLFNAPISAGPVQKLLDCLSGLICDGVKSVHVGFNSRGGEVDQGFFLHEVLCGLPLSLSTHNLACVHSSALMPFLAGAVRFATPAASFLLHATTLQKVKHLDSQRAYSAARDLALADRNCVNLIAERTGVPRSTVARWFREGWLRDSVFSVRHGMTHAVAPWRPAPGVPVIALRCA